MANIRIPLKDETAKLLANGATAVFLPWKEQPPKNHLIQSKIAVDGKTRIYWYIGGTLIKVNDFPCQHGDVLYWLETWLRDKKRKRYLYKADYEAFSIKAGFGKGLWRSPATIPNAACCHVWPDWKIEAVQLMKSLVDCNYVDKECKELLKKLGFKSDLDALDWFKTTYPHLDMNAWGWYIEKGERR